MDFTRALQIDPKYAAAYYSRGLSYAYTGNYNDALADLDSAITIDPQYTDAYFNRARVYYDMDEYDKAWEDVKNARRTGGDANPHVLERLQKATGRKE